MFQNLDLVGGRDTHCHQRGFEGIFDPEVLDSGTPDHAVVDPDVPGVVPAKSLSQGLCLGFLLPN